MSNATEKRTAELADRIAGHYAGPVEAIQEILKELHGACAIIADENQDAGNDDDAAEMREAATVVDGCADRIGELK